VLTLDQHIAGLIDAVPDAMLVVDQAGRIVIMNSAVGALFGYTREELTDQPVEMLLPKLYRDTHPEHRRSYAAKPRVRPIGRGAQLHARRKNGEEFAVDVSLSPFEIAGRRLVVSAIRDVSQRVEETNRRFRSVFQQKHQLAGIVELDGTLTDINDCALAYSGLERANVIGKPFVDTGWWTHDARLRKKLREAIKTAGAGEIATFDATHPKPDGTLGMVKFSIRPVLSANDHVAFLVAESHDITDQRMAEDARDALRRAIEVAEEATSTKSRFMAAASHDLRQPLQSLGIYLSVLDRQVHEPAATEICRKMRQALDVMGELLNALLDVSRFDSGSVKPELKSFGLQEMLNRIVADNSQQAANKGISLVCEPTACWVYSDPALLERIIENFVTNAIRYTEKGAVQIMCTRRGEVVHVEVIDSGIGIPEDSLNAIFDEYHQLDNAVRDRRKGLGLGLAIVKQIAKLLDLPIDVKSDPGAGSTFAVHIPAATSIPAVAPEQPEDVARPANLPGVVLVVDDDPAIVDATTMLLQSIDIDVHTATTGHEALSLVDSGIKPDTVISDYRLPGCNGLELVRRIRDRTSADMPTIIMTGDTSAEEIRSASLSHCEVLSKPVDVDRLISALSALGKANHD